MIQFIDFHLLFLQNFLDNFLLFKYPSILKGLVISYNILVTFYSKNIRFPNISHKKMWRFYFKFFLF